MALERNRAPNALSVARRVRAAEVVALPAAAVVDDRLAAVGVAHLARGGRRPRGSRCPSRSPRTCRRAAGAAGAGPARRDRSGSSRAAAPSRTCSPARPGGPCRPGPARTCARRRRGGSRRRSCTRRGCTRSASTRSRSSVMRRLAPVVENRELHSSKSLPTVVSRGRPAGGPACGTRGRSAAGAPGASCRSGRRRSSVADGDPGLQPGQVHADAHVRSGGERQVPADVRAVEVEAVGVGELRRVAVGAGERDHDQLAGGDRRPGQRRRRASRSGRRRRPPVPSAATPRPPRPRARVGRRPRRAAPGRRAGATGR